MIPVSFLPIVTSEKAPDSVLGTVLRARSSNKLSNRSFESTPAKEPTQSIFRRTSSFFQKGKSRRQLDDANADPSHLFSDDLNRRDSTKRNSVYHFLFRSKSSAERVEPSQSLSGSQMNISTLMSDGAEIESLGYQKTTFESNGLSRHETIRAKLLTESRSVQNLDACLNIHEKLDTISDRLLDFVAEMEVADSALEGYDSEGDVVKA